MSAINPTYHKYVQKLHDEYLEKNHLTGCGPNVARVFNAMNKVDESMLRQEADAWLQAKMDAHFADMKIFNSAMRAAKKAAEVCGM